MTKHFVTFYSPGTFVTETSTEEINCWCIDQALQRAAEIVERHGARPHSFRFFTMERGDDDWEPKRTNSSGYYFLPHCRVLTLEEIKAGGDPSDSILISNMECNGWDRVVTTTSGWKFTQQFEDGDTLLT